jgi:hypothetical protein
VYLEFELKDGKKVEVEFTHHEANIFKDERWSPLVPNTNIDFTFTNRNGYKITTWYGLELHMDRHTVFFRIPDFYINQVVGICGTNDFDKSDDFRLNDGTIIAPDLVDNTVPALGSGNYYRTAQEFDCAESWKIGKLNKKLS